MGSAENIFIPEAASLQWGIQAPNVGNWYTGSNDGGVVLSNWIADDAPNSQTGFTDEWKATFDEFYKAASIVDAGSENILCFIGADAKTSYEGGTKAPSMPNATLFWISGNQVPLDANYRFSIEYRFITAGDYTGDNSMKLEFHNASMFGVSNDGNGHEFKIPIYKAVGDAGVWNKSYIDFKLVDTKDQDQPTLPIVVKMNVIPQFQTSVILFRSLKENDMMAGGNTTGGATGSISNVALFSAPYLKSQEEMEQETPNLADRATVWTWVEDYQDKTSEKTFRGSLDLSWNICKYLTYNLRAGGNIALQSRDRWYDVTLYTGSMQEGYLSESVFNRSNYTVENVFSFNYEVKDIVDISAVAGLTYDDYQSLNTVTAGNDFSIFDFGLNGMHIAGNTEIKQPIQADYQLLSFLARANLSFLNGRYLLTASIRGDGSSKFVEGKRWAYFPAATLAWNLKQEKFMSDVQWLNQLKVRAGYGETGSQSIDPYSTFASYASAFVDSYSGGTVSSISADGSGNKLVGLVVDKLPNDELKWERTRSYNVGLDFAFLKNRITGSLDLYHKTTNDLLIQKELPSSTGYKYMYINQGSMRNKGIEISLTGHIIDTKDFSWDLSGNIAFNDPTIENLGLPVQEWGNGEMWKAYLGNSIGDHFGAANIFIEGKAPGLFYGYQTEGIIQENDPYLTQITNSIGTVAPGNLKFKDQNGDGVINDKDKVILGNPNSKFTYGFQTSFRWRDLSLSMSFNGVYGNDILNTNIRYIGLPSNSAWMVTKDAFYDMYRAENPFTHAYYSNTTPSMNSTTPRVVMDKYIEDGSFLRCSDITLAYTLPKKIVEKIRFTNISVYASVKNAFCITDYSGYDPEVNSFAFDGTRPGIDMSSYPNTRSYIIGLNVSF